MAITFTQTKKRQRYLLVILGLTAIAILVVILVGRRNLPSPITAPVFLPPKIEIDFQTLKNPQLGELETFKDIPAFEGKIGRDNPFVPY
jgi:hypothetical protein